MVAGRNALVTVGGTATTLRVALDAAALLPALVVNAPAEIVLVYVPAVLAVTYTVN
jgi:hypothetical protein